MDLQPKKVRESNFELLRLVCMFFILMHHFVVHGLHAAGYPNDEITGLGIMTDSFTIIAVNCYILISGYFGIKASYKGAFRLYVMCVFYAVVITTSSAFFRNEYNIKDFMLSFFPFLNGGNLWFIQCYFYLFLLSPTLNSAVEKCNKKEHLILLLLWSIVVFYFGFLGRNTGFTMFNFIFLYLVGRFIALYTQNVSTTKKKMMYLGIYFFCSLVIAGTVIILSSLGIDKDMIWLFAYTYGSPLVMFSAVAFFLFFRTLNFKSKVVNWCSTSALAVYLIHENEHINHWIYAYIGKIGSQIGNSGLLAICLVLLALGVLVTCILIDKLRMLITNPIEKCFNRIDWDGYTNKLVNKLVKIIK
jgi:surface polysaccharide O-acyltransferase-like enzyme